VSWNEKLRLCGSSLLEVFPKNVSFAQPLCAILNSTICALAKHVFARQHGREGSLQLDVYAANMLLVPDARRASSELLGHLSESLTELRNRKALPLHEEFGLADRQRLDDRVLQLMGMSEPEEREDFLRRLYHDLREMYKAIREAELEMQKFRRRMARRGRLTPRSIAGDIWDAFDKDDLRHFPQDFTPDGVPTEMMQLAPAKTVRQVNDLFEKGVVRANGHTYSLRQPERAAFVARVLEEGLSGRVPVPTDSEVCSRALAEYDRYRTSMEQEFRERASEYTANEEWKEKILSELWKLHRAHRLGH
jgi:hypothetical protein